MYKVKLSPFAQKGKIHYTEIKRAALQIKPRTNDRKYRDYYKTVSVDSKYMYLTYQWQDESGMMIIFVKNAKWTRKGAKKR